MNSVQYFQKVTPYVRRQGTTTISSKLVNVQPMAPPSGKLYFADSLGMTAEEIDNKKAAVMAINVSRSVVVDTSHSKEETLGDIMEYIWEII